MERLDPKSHQSTVPTRVCRSLFWALVDARGRSNTPPSLRSSQEYLYVSFQVSLNLPSFLWRSSLAPFKHGHPQGGNFCQHTSWQKKGQGTQHPKCMSLLNRQSIKFSRFGGASLVWKRQIVPFPESSGPNTIWKGILAELSALPRPKQEKLHSPAESFKPTFP